MRHKKHRTVYANKKTLELVGCSNEDVLDENRAFFADAIHPEDIERVRRQHEEFTVKDDGYISDIEFRIKAHDDGWRWLRIRETLISRDEMSMAKEILGIAEDVTNLKLASSLLHKNEEMFRRVFDQYPVGSAILDMDMRFIRINRAFCEMIKYEED